MIGNYRYYYGRYYSYKNEYRFEMLGGPHPMGVIRILDDVSYDVYI